MLQHRALHEPAVFSELLGFLTIHVSEMFRDPSYFRTLREEVVPHLKTYPSLKIWIAGCSTGEELYSIAILFLEEGLESRTFLYATDISPLSLGTEEAGIIVAVLIPIFPSKLRNSDGTSSFSAERQGVVQVKDVILLL